jgi:hypothetical protein
VTREGIQKAVVATIGAAVVILNLFAVEVEEEVVTSVVTIVTAALVYAVPNKPSV